MAGSRAGMVLAKQDGMSPIGERLTGDHREIEGLLDSLARAAEDADREALLPLWSDLERRLIQHMDAEERYLLPLIEASHPAEAKRTLLEHARIRDRLCELGLAVELHAVRRTDIQALIEVLRAHAEYEDKVLYVTAGGKASAAVEHRVVATLKAAVRAALRTSRAQEPSSSSAASRAGN